MNSYLPSYSIIIDSATQYFIKIVGVTQTPIGEEIIEQKKVPQKVEETPFFKNLMNRGICFTCRKLDNEIWFGWHISSDEFFRIKRMCELEPIVGEFETLAKYEHYV